ncbi:MAG TPA: redoxin domain-containing protein [Persephonella sp.]|nr:redoxin domain-containing protein [Hydrogenothermaceae bacterium]HIQ24729.1 redoxin domain-containing protein [Persephonella sp.]
MRIITYLILLISTFSFAYEEGKLIGKKAPDFTFLGEECIYYPTDIYYKKNGELKKRCREYHLKDILKKGKPVVIIFWAIGDRTGTYYFLPEMNNLYEKYKDKVEFMAVLLSKSDGKEVQEAKKIIPLKIPVYRAYSDAIFNYNISKVDVPYLVFITLDGKIQRVLLRPESTSRLIEDQEGVHHYKATKEQLEKDRFTIHKDIIAQSIEDIEKFINQLIK